MNRLISLMIAFLVSVSVCSADENIPSSDDLEKMIGQMVMVGFRGLEVGSESPVADDIRSGVGGVVLFSKDCVLENSQRNIASPKQLTRLTAELQNLAQIPLFVAVDQEGGLIARLTPETGFPSTPSAAELGNSGDLKAALRSGKLIGKTLKSVGINMNFAPVVDVNRNAANPVIAGLQRSFSDDPAIVARFADAFIEGLHSEGVISCLKHFPGHGSSEGDSHKGFTDVTSTWDDQELYPFEKLIRDGRVDMVMTAHIFNGKLDERYPATLSRKIINGLLRERMGFDSIVITDDMAMGAISSQYDFKEAVLLAVEAGADILLVGNNLSYELNPGIRVINTLKELVREGKISHKRVRTSYERILKVKNRI